MASIILTERKVAALPALMALSAMLLVGAAGASELDDIMEERYGGDNYYEFTDTEDFVFVSLPQRATVTLVDTESRCARNVGWCGIGDENSRENLFTDLTGQVGEERELPAKVAFALYIESDDGLFWSRRSWNADQSQHVRVLYVDQGEKAGCYVVGFEDLDSRGYTDADYQDAVLVLRGVCPMTEDVIFWGSHMMI